MISTIVDLKLHFIQSFQRQGTYITIERKQQEQQWVACGSSVDTSYQPKALGQYDSGIEAQ